MLLVLTEEDLFHSGGNFFGTNLDLSFDDIDGITNEPTKRTGKTSRN